MSAWGSIDNWRDYRTEIALGEADAYREECAERAMERVQARVEAGMSDDRQEQMKWWAERMGILARARFGSHAECVGDVTGNHATWSIYNGDKRELGPYSWAEMDECMESWSNSQQ